MRITYLTAGAAGMYCGTCIHDNTLARALSARGHDVLLVPLYTPIRTDESDVSLPRVFFGGINVYLQQKSALFRKSPWFLDRLLDRPALLRLLSRFAASTRAADLGELTLSMLRGEQGQQRKELSKLIDWLQSEARPELICLSNSLLCGVVREIKRRLDIPVVCCFSGEDHFLNGLTDRWRPDCLNELRQRLAQVDLFIAPSRYGAESTGQILGAPKDRIHVVPLGLDLVGYGTGRAAVARKPSAGPATDAPLTIGYFGRICPDKGLHLLVDAFRVLRKSHPGLHCRLHVGGYLGRADRPYFSDLCRSVAEWGLADAFQCVGSPDRAGKIAFLDELDVFSMPTTLPETKGLSVLEALAVGVPVVEPRHGCFPELIEATGGGLLVEPNDPTALAEGLATVLRDAELRGRLGRVGREAVHRRFGAGAMADATLAVFERCLRGTPQSPPASESPVSRIMGE